MIKNFKHKGLSRLFREDNPSLLDRQQCNRISRILDTLDAAIVVEDINIPGYGLHKLTGDKKGWWSVKVSGNWRITFCFEGGNVYDVNLEDYH